MKNIELFIFEKVVKIYSPWGTEVTSSNTLFINEKWKSCNNCHNPLHNGTMI